MTPRYSSCHPPVLRIRIRMFLGLDSYCFVTSFMTFYDVNVPSKSNKQKKSFLFVGILKVKDEKSRIRSD
jgi:hypothetical protein